MLSSPLDDDDDHLDEELSLALGDLIDTLSAQRDADAAYVRSALPLILSRAFVQTAESSSEVESGTMRLNLLERKENAHKDSIWAAKWVTEPGAQGEDVKLITGSVDESCKAWR